jgi:glycosyltransferase involved in cell wall biosynthesis
MKKKSTIIIAHGYWGRGGAEIATMYFIESIINDYEVSIVTRGGWDLIELNRVAGTAISSSDINLIKIPLAFILKQSKGGNLWNAIFLRYCRYVGSKYDIRVTASRVIGWGKPAIHFLSDVVWNESLTNENGEKNAKTNVFKNILKHIGVKLSGKSLYELHPNDVFVANSKWTATISSPYTSNFPVVIYPPVVSNFKIIPWEDRKNEFVSIGRISPEKRLEDSIFIVENVRSLGYHTSLTIYGEFDNSDYSIYIRNLIQDKPWIKTPGPVYGVEKVNLLPTFKYGINSCRREAFGISTAEMIKAGVIPFVPYEGAQKEIVNKEELIYSNKKEAINKIICVLESEHLQVRLNKFLVERSKMFSAISFRKPVLKLVGEKVKLNSIEKLVSNK